MAPHHGLVCKAKGLTLCWFYGSRPPGDLNLHSRWQQDEQGMGRYPWVPQGGPRPESSSHTRVRILRFIHRCPQNPPLALLSQPTGQHRPTSSTEPGSSSIHVPHQPLWPWQLSLLCLVLRPVTWNLTFPPPCPRQHGHLPPGHSLSLPSVLALSHRQLQST